MEEFVPLVCPSMLGLQVRTRPRTAQPWPTVHPRCTHAAAMCELPPCLGYCLCVPSFLPEAPHASPITFTSAAVSSFPRRVLSAANAILCGARAPCNRKQSLRTPPQNLTQSLRKDLEITSADRFLARTYAGFVMQRASGNLVSSDRSARVPVRGHNPLQLLGRTDQQIPA